MPDLLTPTVDVPAEKAKLRRLRNEIAADVQRREAEQRKYSPRGYVRIDYLPDVRELEAKGQQGNGQAPNGALRAGPGMVIPAAKADMRQAQACGCRCGRCPCGMGQRGLK
jgi:hypothetical protein